MTAKCNKENNIASLHCGRKRNVYCTMKNIIYTIISNPTEEDITLVKLDVRRKKPMMWFLSEILQNFLEGTKEIIVIDRNLRLLNKRQIMISKKNFRYFPIAQKATQRVTHCLTE